jgi:hypothetical protein
MPTYDGFGFHQNERIRPLRPQSPQNNPEDAIHLAKALDVDVCA